MPMAQLAGGDINYSRSGAGAPLVLLLPQSSGPVGVAPFVAALAERFSVVRYDQRGTGRSAPPTSGDGYVMTDRAREVAELMDALELPRAHVFGNSTGCGIGLAFAAAYPDRVERMVLAAPWSHGDPYLTTMQRLRIAAAEALDAASYARFNASLLYPPSYRRKHEAGFARQAAEASPPDARQFAKRLEAILAFDARPLTPSIACPVLALTAEDDQLMPTWFGREIANGLANGKYVELQGGGHMLPETRTAELAGLVTDFLAGGG